MIDVKAALVEIRRMTKQYKAFENAEQALTVLAGYEQNVDEAKARLAALNEEGGKQVAINADLALWADRVKAGAGDVVADAKAKAEGIIKKALADIAQRREEADVNLANTANALAVLEEKYATLENLLASRTLELKATEKRIDEARATIAQLAKL